LRTVRRSAIVVPAIGITRRKRIRA
jgi:hypothetical protein